MRYIDSSPPPNKTTPCALPPSGPPTKNGGQWGSKAGPKKALRSRQISDMAGLVIAAALLCPTTAAADAGQSCQARFTGWQNYRLGDVVKWRQWKEEEPDGKLYHLEHFPQSIAAAYINATDEACRVLPKGVHDEGSSCNKNIAALAKIAQHRAGKNELPGESELICHLRVGDVIEQNSHSVEELLESELSQYVRTRAHYQKTVAKLPQGINKVVLVAGAHQDISLEKSTIYVEAVASFFREQEFAVTVRSEDPDTDFVFMVHAAHFIQSGGGFSEIVAETASHLGGTVY